MHNVLTLLSRVALISDERMYIVDILNIENVFIFYANKISRRYLNNNL